MEGLSSMTVTEAREMWNKTASDAQRKQEEVRDLVGSRWHPDSPVRAQTWDTSEQQ